MSEETTQATETTEQSQEAVVTDGGQATETEMTYADGQFKSVSDLETGYKELRSSYSKKLGGFDGAPEEYTRAEGIAEGDALYNYASAWGKENQLNDKALNEFVEGYNKQQTEQIESYKSEQIKLLGDDAKYRLENVSAYLKANTQIDDEGLQQINEGLFGAKGIEVLEQLISSTKQATPTQAPVVQAPDTETIKAMRFAKDENGQRKMSVDPAYRQKVENLERQAREARG